MKKNGLLSINDLLFQPDTKDPRKYWIWMRIMSKKPTMARIEARLDVESQRRILSMCDEDIDETERCMCMGFHGLSKGENRLPPLPLVLCKKAVGADILLHLGVISRRPPAAFDYKSLMIGPNQAMA